MWEWKEDRGGSTSTTSQLEAQFPHLYSSGDDVGLAEFSCGSSKPADVKARLNRVLTESDKCHESQDMRAVIVQGNGVITWAVSSTAFQNDGREVSE